MELKNLEAIGDCFPAALHKYDGYFEKRVFVVAIDLDSRLPNPRCVEIKDQEIEIAHPLAHVPLPAESFTVCQARKPLCQGGPEFLTELLALNRAAALPLIDSDGGNWVVCVGSDGIQKPTRQILEDRRGFASEKDEKKKDRVHADLTMPQVRHPVYV